MNAGRKEFDDLPDDSSGDRGSGDWRVSDQQMEKLLAMAYAAPEMSEEFAARLASDLDRQFAQSSQSLNSTALNGTALNGQAHVPYSTVPEVIAIPSRAGFSTRRGVWRWMATVAAAAALLLALGLWNGRPAYGWASMIEALEKCQWVQAITRGSGQQAGIAWFSQDQQIAAREVGQSRVFLNFADRSLENYDADQRIIHERKLNGVGSSSGEFLGLLLSSQDAPFDVGDFEVAEESWSNVSALGEVQIQLLVTLRRRMNGQLVRLELLLDPETHLPKSGRVVDDVAAQVESIEFSYPQQGPDSIFALGVPADTRVIKVNEVGVPIVATATQPSPPVIVEKVVVADGKPSPTDQPNAEAAPNLTEIGAANAARAEMERYSDRIASNSVASKSFEQAIPQGPLAPLGEEELVAKVNQLLSEFWHSQGITPVKPASDVEFLRRVYLDLTGRIPSVSEVYDYLEDAGENRRERLVDNLLSRRDYATHLAAVWRSVLLPEGVDVSAYGGTNKFDSWLADRFGQNMPYDEIVRQLLLAEGRVSESGPLLFYATLKLNPEEIAAKTSRVFLGTRMECAQCHDHPFDERIGQKDFWGFAAHFAQISRPQGKMEMTSSVLRVHDSDFGEVMLPDTDTVVTPKLPDGSQPTEVAGMELSRRRQLADWLTNRNNGHFARAAVNRVWQQVFGRGLVEPVDDMRPDNPSICPEVLELLARDFAASGFDLKRLFKVLVLTDAYQLSSGSPTDEPSQALCFARMNMKNFTADQLYDCIAVATRNEAMTGNLGDGHLARTENMSRQQFIEQFRTAAGDRTDYQAGVPQALTLMHGTIVHGATDLKTSGLLKSLNAPFFTDEQRLNTLFLATLSREPESKEREKLLAYLGEAKDDNERLAVLGDVLWALLNSAEFTFIH